MSNDSHEYVCEFCGEDFETGSKKAGHISWYHRDDRQEEDLITELQRLATEKGHPPEMSEMDTEGEYSRSTYLSHFGTWNDALRAADLEVKRPTNVPKDRIIEAIQALADQLGHPPTVDEMNNHGKYSRKTASKRFGSWNDALRSAGFEPHNEEIPREDLLAEIHRLTEELGHVPAIADLDEHGQYSIKGYLREFGGWDAAIMTAGYEPHTPFRGSDHPRWVGGKERDRLWYGPKWSQQRERAVQRDGFECQRPNCDHTRASHRNQYGRDLHVHHIVPLRSFRDETGEIDYEQANALDNLVTLCIEHHARWEQISPLQPDIRHS
jgi:hypothetical protein